MKKTFAFVICATLLTALFLPLSASALTYETTIAEIVESPFGYYQGTAAITPEETRPDHEIIVPILAKGFKDADGKDIVWEQDKLGHAVVTYTLGPSVSELRRNKIRPLLRVAAGLEAIRDYEFITIKPTRGVPAQAALRIRFVEDLVSTEEVRYRFTIILLHDGKQFDTQETYGGMLSNPEVEVYSHDYVNLEGGYVGVAEITTDEIRVDMGNGVSLYSDMVKGERYYGVAKHQGNDQQGIITKTYSEITDVFELYTVNLKTAGDLVKFTKYADNPHYVYNLKGEYLGTTADRLAYSTKYYLSPVFLKIDVDQETLERELTNQYPDAFPSAAIETFAAGLAEELALNDTANG